MYWVCWHYRGIKVTCSLICARLNKPLSSSKYVVRRFGILNFVIQEKSEPINDSVSCQPALWPRSLAVAHWVCHKTKRTRKYAHATAAATRGRRRRRAVVSQMLEYELDELISNCALRWLPIGNSVPLPRQASSSAPQAAEAAEGCREITFN